MPTPATVRLVVVAVAGGPKSKKSWWELNGIKDLPFLPQQSRQSIRLKRDDMVKRQVERRVQFRKLERTWCYFYMVSCKSNNNNGFVLVARVSCDFVRNEFPHRNYQAKVPVIHLFTAAYGVYPQGEAHCRDYSYSYHFVQLFLAKGPMYFLVTPLFIKLHHAWYRHK